MKYGLIGEKLGHSFSPTVHAMLGDYEYVPREIPRDGIDEFLKARDFLGINVTIPYKQTVIPYLGYIDESAAAIGAVNTIVNREGRLYGYNTDYYGMKMLLSHAGVSAKGRKCAVLGSGGTSRTAEALLKDMGARQILRVSRSTRDGAITYDRLYEEHSDTEIIVNTTPVGMYPNIEDTPIDLSCFTAPIGVIDAVYNPLRTALVLQARKMSVPAEGGLYMLVAQAVRASEIFLDKGYSPDVLKRVCGQILRSKENIVLTGMPASGKSTVGLMLARKTGRRLIDTDDLITDRIGMPIKDFFALYGEEEFRRAESEVIREISAESGLIIATGGGAILREENIFNLKRNGRIYFLDRSPHLLMPTSSRPLSSDTDSMQRRYRERYGIYCSTCDERIDADGKQSEVVNKILENFKNDDIRS